MCAFAFVHRNLYDKHSQVRAMSTQIMPLDIYITCIFLKCVALFKMFTLNIFNYLKEFQWYKQLVIRWPTDQYDISNRSVLRSISKLYQTNIHLCTSRKRHATQRNMEAVSHFHSTLTKCFIYKKEIAHFQQQKTNLI